MRLRARIFDTFEITSRAEFRRCTKNFRFALKRLFTVSIQHMRFRGHCTYERFQRIRHRLGRSALLLTALTTSCLSLPVSTSTLSASSRIGPLTITGAGATLPFPIYSKWFDLYRSVDPSVQFNYQSIGSGGGQRQIMEGTVDFGASDTPMSDENLGQAKSKILHIPTVAGAVAITFHIPGVDHLQLDGPTLVDIFLGKVTRWNDPRIAAQNVGTKLPALDIIVVHRADGSGTSAIFTDYLSKLSPEWKSQVGSGTSVSWPAGIGGKGSEGVTGQIRQTPGAIGYVELIYALQNRLPLAALKNADGLYVAPGIESASAAIESTVIPSDFRVSLINASGARSYPIVGLTYLLVDQHQKDSVKGRKLVGIPKMGRDQRR